MTERTDEEEKEEEQMDPHPEVLREEEREQQGEEEQKEEREREERETPPPPQSSPVPSSSPARNVRKIMSGKEMLQYMREKSASGIMKQNQNILDSKNQTKPKQTKSKRDSNRGTLPPTISDDL